MPHLRHLRKDKKLSVALKNAEEIFFTQRPRVYLNLCSSIISQQLSTRVAEVIYQRFLNLFSRKLPSIKDILLLDIETLRSIGLSYSKAQYVLNVCTFFQEHNLTDQKLRLKTDEELIELLTQIKGIGRWTVEMILMFSLGREDVFAVDDLGIQQGMAALYDLDQADKKKLQCDMREIAETWRPYRSYACRYIWKWKDGK